MVYSEPCQISKMELFAKIVIVNYFHKKLHLRCLRELQISNKVSGHLDLCRLPAYKDVFLGILIHSSLVLYFK